MFDKNNPAWISAAHNLNDQIKMLHKEVDKVGYKSEIGKALLQRTVDLKTEFIKTWGAESLLAALFVKRNPDPKHKTVINKKSCEDF
jgi:hypothetical protein